MLPCVKFRGPSNRMCGCFALAWKKVLNFINKALCCQSRNARRSSTAHRQFDSTSSSMALRPVLGAITFPLAEFQNS
jgi:hypothetical protein